MHFVTSGTFEIPGKITGSTGSGRDKQDCKESFFLIFSLYNFLEKDVYSWTLQCEIHEVSSEGLLWLFSWFIMHLEVYKRVNNKLCQMNFINFSD